MGFSDRELVMIALLLNEEEGETTLNERDRIEECVYIQVYYIENMRGI